MKHLILILILCLASGCSSDPYDIKNFSKEHPKDTIHFVDGYLVVKREYYENGKYVTERYRVKTDKVIEDKHL